MSVFLARLLHPARAFLLLTLPLLSPSATSAATGTSAIRNIVDQTIRPLMATHDLPGMAVGVTVNGRTGIFNYGVASRESRQAVDDATLFEIGSLSKTLTATLATYAQAQGKLALDAHPSRYWPALKGSAIDQATLLHLGTYTAGGLPLQFPNDVTDAVPLAYYRHWRPSAAPGLMREYSNPSLGLFGDLTARALHVPFAQAAETILFPGLGMRHTYIDVPSSAMSHYAWGYRDARPVRMNPEPFSVATYGVRTTAADMIHFLALNMSPATLAPPMRQAIAGTQVGYFKVGAMTQGLGWEQYAYPASLQTLLDGNSERMIRDPNPAQRVVSRDTPDTPAGPRLFDKTGSTGGFGAYAVFVPATRIGIVLLANRNYPIAARVRAAHSIMEQLGALSQVAATAR